TYPSKIPVSKSLGYVEMLKLLQHAKIVLTDSGGLQKEAFWSRVPCITLRDRTEWIETVEMNVNFLVKADADEIVQTINLVERGYDLIMGRFTGNPFGDGYASRRVIDVVRRVVEGG
ncbi:MAG: UDP-N-acetylglucosamine 2-epimerase, partial [Thermoproteota archaeon]